MSVPRRHSCRTEGWQPNLIPLGAFSPALSTGFGGRARAFRVEGFTQARGIPGRIAIMNHHVHAFPMQRARDDRADAAGGAGDEYCPGFHRLGMISSTPDGAGTTIVNVPSIYQTLP